MFHADTVRKFLLTGDLARAQNAVKKSFEQDPQAATERMFECIVEIGALVLRNSAPDRKEASERLTKDFGALCEKESKETASLFQKHVSDAAQLSAGYERIFAALQQEDFSKNSPDVRLAAVLRRCEAEVRALLEAVAKHVRSAKELFDPASLQVGPPGKAFRPDPALEGLLDATAGCLLLLCYENKWLVKGIAVVPPPPLVHDDVVESAGVMYGHGLTWEWFQYAEETLRFLGGAIETDAKSLPKGAKLGLSFKTEDSVLWRAFDLLAHERRDRMLWQHRDEMERESNIDEKVAKEGERDIPLIPTRFVSEEEAFAALNLCTLLQYAIVDDHEKYLGLSLVEWVRAYAAVQLLAQQRSEESLFPVFKEDEFLGELMKLGLSSEAARKFVFNSSWGTGPRRDLFDCPLIQLMDGRIMLAGAAALRANIALVVLSRLRSAELEFGKKGALFEQRVLERLKRAGLNAIPLKFERNGAEYEFDAILPWGDFLFIFECKNYALSEMDPGASARFGDQIGAASDQVKRLVRAVEEDDREVRSAFGLEKASWSKVVPIVLNAMPFSTGAVDGVYVYDFSALSRFLEERYLHAVAPARVGKTTIMRRVAIADLWKGNKPSAEAFLKQLDEPIQIAQLREQFQATTVGFWLDRETVAKSITVRRERTTMDQELKTLGIDPNEVRDAFTEFKQQVKKLRKKLKPKS